MQLGGRPTKHHGRPAMSCGLPALDKFLCGLYTSRKYVDKFLSGLYISRKYVVMLGHAVMVVSYDNNLKVLKFLNFCCIFLLLMTSFLSMITMCCNIKLYLI
jgi:hypothetical protein